MLKLIKNDNALLINNAAAAAALSASIHSHNTPSLRAGLIRRTGTLLHVARSPAQGRFRQTPAAAAARALTPNCASLPLTHSMCLHFSSLSLSLFPTAERVRLQSKNKDE
jgi:hypothetical protein